MKEENQHTKNEDVVEEYGKYYERIKQQYEENYPEGGYDFETYVMDEAFNERSEHIKTVKQRNEAWKKNEILYSRFRQSKQDNKTNRDRLKSLAIDNLRILFLDFKDRIEHLSKDTAKIFGVDSLKDTINKLHIMESKLDNKNDLTVDAVIDLSYTLGYYLFLLEAYTEDSEFASSDCVDFVTNVYIVFNKHCNCWKGL